MTQTALSNAVGMSQGAYSQLEKGGEGSERTASLAAALGVSPFWLETGAGLPGDGVVEVRDGYERIRRVGASVNASVTGAPVDFVDEDGAPVWFQRGWLESKGLDPAKLFAMGVRGSSMEPTLYDGDLVIFNTSKVEPRDGRVYVVDYEGEMVVKRITRDAGQWWLYSDNPDKSRYPRKACNGHSRVLGEVIYRQSSHI